MLQQNYSTALNQLSDFSPAGGGLEARTESEYKMSAFITTNMNATHRNDLDKLAAWLQQHAPEDILMPLIAKHPMEPHAGNVWSWEAFFSYPHLSSVSDFGILMKGLFCVDFDNADLFQRMKDEHPEWFEEGTYALARTSKGYHYICRRSELCDAIPLYDKSRLLDPQCVPREFLDSQNQVPIDIKTRCSTGTGGVLVVAPSHDKTWIIAPWELPTMKPVPDSLVYWLLENLKKVTRERFSQRREGTVSDPKLEGEWTCGMNENVAIALAKLIVTEGNVYKEDASLLQLERDPDSEFYRRKNNQVYFRTRGQRKCPYRSELHDSNNFALIFTQNGCILHWCFGAVCKDAYHGAKDSGSLKPVGRWYDLTALDVDGPGADTEFKLTTCKKLTDEWDELMASRPAKRDVTRLDAIKSVLMPLYNRFFIVVKSSKPCMLELKYNASGKICHFDRRQIRETLYLYRSTFFEHVWFRSGERNEVDRIVYEIKPDAVPPKVFNAFLGLKVEFDHGDSLQDMRPDTGKIALVLELLLDVWAGGDQNVYDYILNWFAYPLQRREKTGVCLVVISEQGYGKGTIAELVGKHIYGESERDDGLAPYVQIGDIDSIVGKFNSIACMRMFINADECGSYGGAFKQSNNFKNKITASKSKLENKGVDAVPVSDYANYLLTTNNDDPVRVETSDRRFVILQISPELKKSPKFFEKLYASIGEGAGVHLYKFLMARDLSKFVPQLHRPITAVAKRMMVQNIPPVALFLQSCVESRSFKVEMFGDGHIAWKEGQTMSTTDLYAAFEKWVGKNPSASMDQQAFGCRLSKYVSGWKKEQVRSGPRRGERNFTLLSPEQMEATLRSWKHWTDI